MAAVIGAVAPRPASVPARILFISAKLLHGLCYGEGAVARARAMRRAARASDRMSKRIVTTKRCTAIPAERLSGESDTPVRHRAQPDTRGNRTRLRRVSDKSVRPTKKPFHIDDMVGRIREALRPFPKAAMFELAERRYDSVFHVLVGCIISIRTLDEVSLPTSLKLFEAAPTPRDVAKLSVARIDELIHAC